MLFIATKNRHMFQYTVQMNRIGINTQLIHPVAVCDNCNLVFNSPPGGSTDANYGVNLHSATFYYVARSPRGQVHLGNLSSLFTGVYTVKTVARMP